MSVKFASRPDFVIYINWDGFSYQWYEMVNASYAGTPHLNALLKDGTLCTRSEPGVPSITGAMQQCIASGAWPADTGNYYKYYNLAENRVVQFRRDNRLENIAEAAARHGIRVTAVNAWYFENRGTFEGNVACPYIQTGLPSNFSQRVDAMIKVIKGEVVMTGGKRVVFDQMPRFLAVYADDIDTVGHNLKVTYEGLHVADTRGQWHDNLAQTIMFMDADLGRLVEALKERGVYERTAILLTTDHGMVQHGAAFRLSDKQAYPPEAYTKLPDLADAIAEAGIPAKGRRYRVEVLPNDGMQAQADTEIVIVPCALQAQITFRFSVAAEDVAHILSQLKREPYYGGHLTHEELVRGGTGPDYADLLISARPPYGFRPDPPGEPRAVAANHDSLHGQVRHIFTMLAGAGVKRNAVYEGKVTIADIAPTIARLLGFEGPGNAVGTSIDGALEANLQGPPLRLFAYEGDGFLAGKTDPGANIRINGQEAGVADEQGLFRVSTQLYDGMNRLVVEAERDGRKSRHTIYMKSTTSEVTSHIASVRT